MDRVKIAAAALLFSTGGVAIKSTTLDAWQVAAGRSLIAAVLFAAIFRVRPASLNWRALLAGVFYGATMIGFVVANKLTTANNAIFLQYTAPLYVVVLAPLLLKEPWQRVDGIVAVLMLAGLTCFALVTDPTSATAPNPSLGNLIAAVDGFFWAGTLLSLRWLTVTDEASVPAAVVLGNVVAVCVALPYAFPLEPSATDMAVIFYLGCFQISAAYVLMLSGMKTVPTFESSTIMMTEPVLSALLAFVVFAEQPGAWALVGSAIILLATGVKAVEAPAAATEGNSG